MSKPLPKSLHTVTVLVRAAIRQIDAKRCDSRKAVA